MAEHLEFGKQGELEAQKFLHARGYQILQVNWRYKRWEIDIIAKDGVYMVFCEVKYRGNGRKGNPLEAVDVKKQNVIFRCAMYYLTENHIEDVPCRFDVVGIQGKDGMKDTEITYIKNAFTG